MINARPGWSRCQKTGLMCEFQSCLGACRVPTEPTPTDIGIPISAHKLNADQTVAVATDVYWNEDMSTCPRGVKCQLIGAGGVAMYHEYRGDPFWVGWSPLPKRRRKV